MTDQYAFALTILGGEGKIELRAGLVIDANTSAPGIVEVEKNCGPETFDYKRFRNIARSAEHLVAFDLLQRGLDTFVAAEGLAYDLVADIAGLRRIQVKSTKEADRPVGDYSYAVYRFKAHQSDDLRRYRDEVDLMAFVAIDRKLIFYRKPIYVERPGISH